MTKRKLDQLDSEGVDNNSPPPQVKKRSPLGEMWMSTLNNWTQDHMDQLEQFLAQNTDIKCTIGKEVGAEGTPHLQMFFNFGKRVRPCEIQGLKELPIHWGDRNGKPQRKKQSGGGDIYCAKDGDYKCYNGAFVPRQLVLPEMDRWWQIKLLEYLNQPPDDRTIYWVWSDEKGTGKTTTVKWLIKNMRACLLDGKKNDIKNGVLTWEKTRGYPELCVWNIPASLDADYISYVALEQVKDMCFYSGKYEGGAVCGPCPHIVVFANIPPNPGNMDELRFVELCIDSTV